MANKIGNNDWTKRKRHGKPKAIKTPGVLWNAFCDYAKYVDDNPAEVEETKSGKNKETKVYKKPLPYTWDGFEDYLFSMGLISDLKDYKSNSSGAYDDYSPVIMHIGKIIRNQKFQGAAAGLFNSNIIARDLGLADKKETKHKGTLKVVSLESLDDEGSDDIE